jgi:hopanoid biosynthesis associated radical SAM protein HpnH
MAIPFRQSVRIGAYLMRQRIARREKYPLLVELEPLFQCNLACSFCGKIQHPEHILKKRMPVDQALGAIEESGAPMVSIAGGEPLVHPEVHVIASELVKRRKFVFLCTNAILMQNRMERFAPSPYFTWVVHLDGMRERHDQFVERAGIFDIAVDAIREAKRRGFRVSTNTTS